MENKKIVFGVIAHVDSGKTTLSEALLYNSGEIKKLGRVDHGNAFLDSHIIEKNRGITIFSKQAVFNIGNTTFTLLDTPGHVDFSAEMERTLQVLDYAVLVISGTDGVQSHTETLWNLLKIYKIPTFIFVNKMDLAGAKREDVLFDLRKNLSDSCFDFNKISMDEQWLEDVSVADESLMNDFFETGELKKENIVKAIKNRKITPCFFGSALKLKGVEEFISALEYYTIPPQFQSQFGCKVYKIGEDEQGNRLTYMKITGGTLKVRDTIKGETLMGESWSEKINQIRVYSGIKYKAMDSAPQGTVCVVTGLTKTYPGQGLGVEPESERTVLEPVLNYKVEIPIDIDPLVVLGKLRILEEEEPQLHVIWNETLGEVHVQLMGQVQMEIIKSIVKDRFNIPMDFGKGNVVYKETILETVEGIGHFEPLRHYSEVHLILEPTELGKGLIFKTNCREDELDKNWQRLILTHLEEKVHKGVLTGSPITDMKITVASGKAHVKHTEGGDFRESTYRAVRNGLRRGKSVLLEPWYNFKLEVPSENIGRAITDFHSMCAEMSQPETYGDTSILTGSVPVSAVGDYQIQLNSYTKGKGKLSLILKGYEPCHNQEEVINSIGYNVDNDVLNTADSVFCSHGSGFIVKWDEIEKYMHLESVLNKKVKTEEYVEVSRRRVAEYCDSFAEDKDLMRIFEQTYGPIKKDPRKAFAKSSGTKEVKYKSTVKTYDGPQYLLVDGYNIIFAWDELKELAKDNLESARNKLIQILCNYRGFSNNELIVVFDAYKVKGNVGEVEKIHNITVVYTKEAETADMYIEKSTHALAKNHKVRVATSDYLEQVIVLGHGATRVSAREFYEEVKKVENAIREFITE